MNTQILEYIHFSNTWISQISGFLKYQDFLNTRISQIPRFLKQQQQQLYTELNLFHFKTRISTTLASGKPGKWMQTIFLAKID